MSGLQTVQGNFLMIDYPVVYPGNKVWTPLPNDVIGDSIVVASVVYNEDDYKEAIFLVLLLNKQPPFFTVATMYWPSEEIIARENHFNIVHAIEEYKDSGGDV